MSNTLLEHHLKDLRSSGLSEETIRLSGCFSASAEECKRTLGFSVSAGLVFPYFHEGKRGSFARVKPDKPFTGKGGKKAKYLTPRGGANRLYLLPSLQDVLRDTGKLLVITEGEKKTLKANEMGIPTVGLAGVWSWKTKNSAGESLPIPDMELIEWKNRKVYIVFDSDIEEKEEVQWAEFKLAEELVKRGALVECVRISKGNDGAKQGLDDYLLKHTAEEFRRLPKFKPQQPLSPKIEDLLENFKKDWAGADEIRRDELLITMVYRLEGCSILQRGRAMSALKSITGHTKKVLEDLYQQTRGGGEKKEKAPPPPLEPSAVSGLMVVSYIVNRNEQNELFGRLLEVLAPTKRFYNFNNELHFIRRGIGPVFISERNLNGILSSFLEIAHCVDTGKEIDLKRYGPLSGDISKTFVYSPRVIAQFPELKQYTRSPVFDTEWNFIAEPGFHPAGGIYYDGPKLEPGKGMETINRVLGDFCWKTSSDRSNYLGMLLTALTMPHWLNGHPFIAFNGNKPGVGKSLLAKVLSIIVDGRMPGTVSFNPDDEEFEKQLATRISEGDRVVIIDNAKRTRFVKQVESQVLERSVTDSTLNFRRLGKNSAISRLNDVIFCLTMNFTKMSPDLRRRNIPINLEQTLNVRQAQFGIKDMESYVREHRLEIIAELAGMVRKWLEHWPPPEVEKPARHSVNQKWAESIDGILKANGFCDFLENFNESESAFDPDYACILEICREYHNESPKTASEWAQMLGDNILEDKLQQAGKPKSKRSQAVIVGNLFTQYLDTVLKIGEGKEYAVICVDHGKGHPKEYFFQTMGANNV